MRHRPRFLTLASPSSPIADNEKSKPSGRPKAKSEGPGPLQQAATTLGLVAMSFLVGALVADSGMFPYEPYLKRGFQALRSSVSEVVRVGLHDVGDIWQPARSTETGVLRYDAARSAGGYTLYTSGHGEEAFLVDMKGEVVHTWKMPFEQAFPDPEHVSDPIGGRIAYFRRAHLFPNGDLLALYEGYGDTPWGLGLVKLDRNSKVLWRYAERAHHDLEVADDGTITTLIHEMRDIGADPIEGTPLSGEVVEDFVVQLDPQGRELRRVNVLEALARSPWTRHIGQMRFPDFEVWDPLHTNDVSVVGPQFAARNPFAEPGQVMISMRTIDLIALLDLQRDEVVWAARGPWIHQHDPDPLPNGNILLFDNFGHKMPGGASQVLEFSPATNAVVWSFTGSDKENFSSLTRSSQQVLPNGNIQIVESDGARILEVTRAGDIVWEFRSPQTRKDGSEVAIIADAQRVDDVSFLK